MEFTLDDDQRSLRDSLERMLAKADTPAAARAWAGGDHGPGLDLWRGLADIGLTTLAVAEAVDLPPAPVELTLGCESLGRHAVPGPWLEQVFLSALLPRLAGFPGPDDLAAGLAAGTEVLTVAAPPWTPYALDADAATRVLLVDGDGLHAAVAGEPTRSVDPARRLFRVTAGERLADVPQDALAAARDTAALCCAAMLLGLGEALLERSVEYVKQRRQFGRPVGEYQALKHALADVRIGLDFARPLVYGAALADGPASRPRDVSAAKAKAAESAYRAARTALQVHGAVGYTAELDLSLWLLKTRALVTAWGTPAVHRARVLASLVEEA